MDASHGGGGEGPGRPARAREDGPALRSPPRRSHARRAPRGAPPRRPCGPRPCRRAGRRVPASRAPAPAWPRGGPRTPRRRRRERQSEPGLSATPTMLIPARAASSSTRSRSSRSTRSASTASAAAAARRAAGNGLETDGGDVEPVVVPPRRRLDDDRASARQGEAPPNRLVRPFHRLDRRHRSRPEDDRLADAPRRQLTREREPPRHVRLERGIERRPGDPPARHQPGRRGTAAGRAPRCPWPRAAPTAAPRSPSSVQSVRLREEVPRSRVQRSALEHDVLPDAAGQHHVADPLLAEHRQDGRHVAEPAGHDSIRMGSERLRRDAARTRPPASRPAAPRGP